MMENSFIKFAEDLLNKSAILEEAWQKTLDYWAPDKPPDVMLFAALGKEIARNFNDLTEETRQAIFKHIENGMTSKDRAITEAVATGLLEALVSESDEKEGLWSRIEPQLGELSKRHADGWRDFGSPL